MKTSKKPKLGTGKRFASLAGSVAKSYKKAGKSPEKAKEIGNAVAGKIMWEKYGKKKGSSLIKMGKKKK